MRAIQHRSDDPRPFGTTIQNDAVEAVYGATTRAQTASHLPRSGTICAHHSGNGDRRQCKSSCKVTTAILRYRPTIATVAPL